MMKSLCRGYIGIVRFLIAPVLLAGLFFFACNRLGSETVVKDFTPLWDSVTPLENPDKGWYHHLHDNEPWRYEIRDDSIFHSFPGMDHIYLRLAWSFLEPEEGKFDWQLIDTIVEKYVPLGYGISFRITCKERRGFPEGVAQLIDGVNYATPYWVRQAGAQGQVSLSKGTDDVYAWSPDWDDPVYLEKLDNFHRAFAERYDDKPWVRYVDVGSIGDYGEGHTGASTLIPVTFEEARANIDIHLNHYKKSQIVVTDALIFRIKEQERVGELYDYVAANGITLRDDSPMVSWHMNKYRATWSISHPHFYDPLYLERPTILELQHYSAVKRDGKWLGKDGRDTLAEFGVPGAEFFRKSIDLMHATYIGYHGYTEDFLTDNPDLAGELLNRCGYWYFPVHAEYPMVMGRGQQSISVTWLNRGVAPAYRGFSLVLNLESLDHCGSHKVLVPDAGNRKWLPGEPYHSTYTFDLPDNVSSGKYLLKFKLKNTGSDRQRDVFVAVDTSAMDHGHFISVGEVIVNR